MKEQNEKLPKDDKITQKPQTEEQKDKEKPEDLDPTRYGDWEKDGRCIDF